MGGFDEAATPRSRTYVLRNRVSNSTVRPTAEQVAAAAATASRRCRRRNAPPGHRPGTCTVAWQMAEAPIAAETKVPRRRHDAATGTTEGPTHRCVGPSTGRRGAARCPQCPGRLSARPRSLEIPPELDSSRAQLELEPMPRAGCAGRARAEQWFETPPLDIDVSGFESDDLDVPISMTRGPCRADRAGRRLHSRSAASRSSRLPWLACTSRRPGPGVDGNELVVGVGCRRSGRLGRYL